MVPAGASGSDCPALAKKASVTLVVNREIKLYLTRLTIGSNLVPVMMDYNKTREDASKRKAELTKRSQEIAEQRKRLDEEVEDIEREMVGLDQIIEGLDFVASSGELEPPPVPGLTEHIRTVLQQTTVPLLPTQIRDSCLSAGIKGTSDKYLLISVHNALRKMKPNLRESRLEGKTAYIWKPSLGRAFRRARTLTGLTATGRPEPQVILPPVRARGVTPETGDGTLPSLPRLDQGYAPAIITDPLGKTGGK